MKPNEIIGRFREKIKALPVFFQKFYKNEFKGNILVNVGLALRHLITRYRNYFLMAAAVAVIIFISLLLYVSGYEKKVNEANRAFESALSLYRRTFIEKDMTPESRYQSLQESINGFQYVINSYSATPLKYDALIYQGNAYFELNDYPNALQKYQQLINEKSGHYFADFVLINIAKCYEQMNNIQAAVETYNRLLSQYKKKSNAAYALFSLGKIYELTNKLNEAVQIYQQLYQQFPYSVWSQEARRRILFLQTFAQPKK